MIDVKDLLQRYCAGNDALFAILWSHGNSVAQKAKEIARLHPEWSLDLDFLYEAAMLHDIGVTQGDAAGIHCYGTHPYICHGYLGADILRSHGLEAHARIAERHTGTGLTAAYIAEKGLPLPTGRQYTPETLYEQLICYADKFFSKTKLDQEKSMEKVEASLAKWEDASLERFKAWTLTFYPEHQFPTKPSLV
jgi:uncharacterized protein